MKNIYSNVACDGMDVHYKFSNVTFRDEAGRVVRRERLEYPQAQPTARMSESLAQRIANGHGGFVRLSDLLSEADLEPHLSNC